MKRFLIWTMLLLGAVGASAQEPAAAVSAAAADPNGAAAVEGAVSAAAEGAAAVEADGASSAADGTSSAAGATDAAAVTPEQLWDLANTAYIHNDFRTAIDRYRAIEAQGLRSAKLCYNLANALFKQERLGEAILWYRRALRLAPGDEDIRYNLAVAEARTKDTIERIPEFAWTTWVRALRRTMNATAWTVLSLVALAATGVLVLVYLLARRLSLRKAGFYGLLAAAGLFVVTTLFAAGQRREQLNRDEAVVMATSAAVKSSPDRAATDLFVLHEGTTLRITNRLEGWCEVTIADGKKGWTERRNIEEI